MTPDDLANMPYPEPPDIGLCFELMCLCKEQGEPSFSYEMPNGDAWYYWWWQMIAWTPQGKFDLVMHDGAILTYDLGRSWIGSRAQMAYNEYVCTKTGLTNTDLFTLTKTEILKMEYSLP